MDKTFIQDNYLQIVVGNGLAKPAYAARIVNGQREFLRGRDEADVYGGSCDMIRCFENLPDGRYEARSYNPRGFNNFMIYFVIEGGKARKTDRSEVFNG